MEISVNEGIYDPDNKYWKFSVKTNNIVLLKEWLDNNIKDYECIFRYNSGDPLYLLSIKDNSDLLVFKMRWM